MTSVGTIRP